MVAQIKMANSALDPALGISTQPSGSTDNPYIEVVTSEAGKFKVPTLRNVERTAPFGHNGFFATLEEITRFYNTRDVPEAGWPGPEVALNVNTDELGDLGLSPEEEAAIVAFMRTLTD
jgi:cytochrome c peroxidase